MKMTFKGELYNRDVSDISDIMASFKTASSETPVSRLSEVRGSFGYVIENENYIVAVRDQFGTHPFYYYVDAARGTMLCSDSVIDLLAKGVPRKLSRAGFTTYMAFGCLMHPWTMVEGVKVVPPASCVIYDKATKECKIVEYWRPNFKTQKWKIDDLQNAINNALMKSLERQLNCGGNPAAFLSGGIDSSAIVALIRQLDSKGDIRTYCVTNENPQYDERTWAKLVADRNKTNHKELLLKGEFIREHLEEAINSYDQPSMDGLNFWFGFRLLREVGEKILLSGEAGDELFFSAMGKQVLAHKYDRYFRWMPKSLGGIVERLATTEKIRKLGQLMGADVPTFFITRRILSERRIANILKQDVLDFYGVHNPFIDIKRDEADIYNYISWMDVRNFSADMYLRDGYQTGMSNRIGMRMPLYDVDLAEILYSVDGDIKYSTENPKYLLVNACGDGIPVECVKRPKMGFSLPFKDYFQGELKDKLDAFLMAGDTKLFKPEAIRELGRQFYAGKVYWSNIWIPFMAENWCRQNKIEL